MDLRILSLVLSGSLQAATYYVAPTGADSNPGSVSLPFQTIQAGVNAAGAGDTIIVQDGTYSAPSSCTDPNGSMAVNIGKAGTASAPITLMAANKWKAVLDAQMLCHSYINFQEASAWWIIQGFEIKNGYSGGVWSNSGGGKNVTLRGLRIHNIGNRSNSTTTGEVGIYTDSGAVMTVD